MCGKGENTLLVNVEGVKMKLCKSCSKYGKVLSSNRERPIFRKQIRQEPEIEQLVVNNYGQVIKTARESLQLTQEDLAKKLNEKESLIQKIESQHKEPSVNTARKLEKFLRIKLIEQHEEVSTNKKVTSSQGMTIGDMIKLK